MQRKLEPIPLPWPSHGVSDDKAFANQDMLTTRSALNVRTLDPKTGRARGAQRSGTSKYVAGQVTSGGGPVRDVQKVTYDLKLVDYAALSGSAITTAGPEWSTKTPSQTVCRMVVTDRQSNTFALDGDAGVVKYNEDGVEVWKFSLPVGEANYRVRALGVDDLGGIYCGTTELSNGLSESGKQSTTKLWRILDGEEEPELAWEVEPDAYTAALKVAQGKLYTVQNQPRENRAFVRVYRFITDDSPSLEWEREVPHPARDMDVGPDGSIFVACDENANRGIDPLGDSTSARGQDWTPEDLDQYEERAWAWIKNENLDGASNAFEDGADVEALFDFTGNGRDLLPPASGGTFTAVDPPTYRKRGSTGLPCVFFDQSGTTGVTTGTAQGLEGAPATNTDRRYRAIQQSFLPTYEAAEWVMFLVVRTDTNVGSGAYPWGAGRTLVCHQHGGSANGWQLGVNVASTAPSTTPTSRDVAGQIAWQEGDTPTNGNGGSGQPAPGRFDQFYPYTEQTLTDTGGYAIITVGMTNGNSGRSSFLRVNGQPVDEWDTVARTSTNRFRLGFPQGVTTAIGTAFEGEIYEILVLSDYTDVNGDLQLIERPPYPGAWTSGNLDTECERVEGYLGHKFGIAGVLPQGESVLYQILTAATTAAFAGDIEIGRANGLDAYRLVTTPSAKNEIALDSSVTGSLLRLAQVINGSPGATAFYSSTATDSPLFNDDAGTERIYASEDIFQTTGSGPSLTGTFDTLRFRQEGDKAANSFSVGAAGSLSAQWSPAIPSNEGSSEALTASAAEREANWPHSFRLPQGPPGDEYTNEQPTAAGLFGRPSRLLVKLDQNGNPVWVIDSAPDGANDGVGGVGYGVRVSQDTGAVYSIGPKSTGPFSSGSTAEQRAYNASVRKIQDDGDSFTLDNGTVSGDETGTWVDVWGTLGGTTYEPADKYPRMWVDKFDNLYVPVFVDGLAAGVYQYAKTPTAVATSELDPAREIEVDGTTEQDTYSVAVDPNIPDYDGPGLTSPELAEKIVVGSSGTEGPTGQDTVWQYRLVSVTPNDNSPRALRVLGVADGEVRVLASGAFTDPALDGVTQPVLENDAGGSGRMPFIDSVEAFGKAYFTDGQNYIQYDAREGANGTLSEWKASGAGRIPKGAALITVWNGRLVLARFADDPQNWAMSGRGEPGNWDFFPAVFRTDSAVLGNDSQIGVCPDIINTLIRYDDDTILFGGDSTVQRMAGDPLENGRFELVSDETGIAFGPSWTKLPDNTIVFFGSRGGVYVMRPGGVPERVTLHTIEDRLRDIDLSANYVSMEYNYRDEGVHLFVVPFDTNAAVQTHYFFDFKHAFVERGRLAVPAWPDQIGSQEQEITSSFVLDGDDPDDRVLLMGCGDGYIRKWDKDAADDDSTRIVSEVDFGPLVPNVSREVMFSGLNIVLADDQDGAVGEFFVRDTPDTQDGRTHQFTITKGRNGWVRARMRGTYAYVRMKNAALGQRWAFEEMSLIAEPRGMQRRRT